MRVLPKEKVLELVRSKAMSPKEAIDALRPEPEEFDKLDEIKKILKDISTQNIKLIEIAKADLTKPEGGKEVINALQSQTESIINSLKKLEKEPSPGKEWEFIVNRDRQGKISSIQAKEGG